MCFFRSIYIYKKLNSIKPKVSQMAMTGDIFLSLFMDTEGIIMFAV